MILFTLYLIKFIILYFPIILSYNKSKNKNKYKQKIENSKQKIANRKKKYKLQINPSSVNDNQFFIRLE